MYTLYNGSYDRYCAGGGFRPPSFSVDVLDYWERSFFQRLRALIQFDGLPEGAPGQVAWDYDAFLYQLLRTGFGVVFNSKTYGLVIQPGTPAGYGLQFQPRGMMIATPFFQFDRPLEIGTECAVIKLTPDYRGVWDIVRKYAVEMQVIETAIRQAAINSRFAYAAVASNDKDRATLEALFQQLENGKPAVVVNANLRKPNPAAKETEWQMPIQQFDRDLSKNFILPDLYEIRRGVLQDFYRELGIRVTPQKKERVNTMEVSSSDAETFNRREVWKITLDQSLEVCNNMYGTHITAEINEPDDLLQESGQDTEDGGSPEKEE